MDTCACVNTRTSTAQCRSRACGLQQAGWDRSVSTTPTSTTLTSVTDTFLNSSRVLIV